MHSLNTSPGKQKYSFGKNERFHYDKPKYVRYDAELMRIICLLLIEIGEVRLLGMGRGRWDKYRRISILSRLLIPMIFLLPCRSKKAMHFMEGDM